ncbi:GHKL domain-containing protein [Anaerotignum sp.]|uniref:GHKL domain-containing protein n=1 Tax=Anaerotignum sp. TaxID=2039241 RepID=UPI0028A59434|nr:GHKL domain-containing protein [Anaerotignum sp.]
MYAPAKIYADNQLIYEFGDLADYPDFMVDPATEVYLIAPRLSGENITLRMEFLSPVARDVLTVHPPLIGSIKNVFNTLMSSMLAPFAFSTVQLLAGVLLILISLFVVMFERQGIMFFWLGVFSLATGAWAFGECNLTGLIIKNPTMLYLLAFTGLFTLAVPILYFAKSTIGFHNPKLVWLMAIFMSVAASVALLLQLLGLVPLSKSMYLFHILVPLTLSILAGLTVYEWLRYGDMGAKRFVLPIGVLALSSVLEVFNYSIRFTYLFASLFQMGVLFFIVFTGITGGLYIRDVIALKNKQQALAFEMNLMEMQVEEQKKHSLLLVENAQALGQQRHDLRHQLAVLQELADSDNDKLKAHLNSLVESIPLTPKSYCGNMAVNAIVSRYASICEKSEIAFDTHLTVPQRSEQIPDSSLCVIFGNLLENAVEACGRMTEGHKFIRLNSSVQYDVLTITMDNSFDGKVSEENGRFRSRKREEFGVGLSSVQTVARKSQGDAQFEQDGLVFLSSVYVRI